MLTPQYLEKLQSPKGLRRMRLRRNGLKVWSCIFVPFIYVKCNQPSTVLLRCISQMYFSTVFLKCISQVYFSNVFLKCISQVYFSNVFLKCISQVYFSSVFLKCVSQVYFTSVFLKCISQMYFSTVLFMCISSCAQLISAKCSSSPTQQCTATPIYSCNLDCAQILLDYSSVWKLNEYSFGYVSLFLWLHIHLSLFHLRFCLCSFYVISMVPIMFRPSVLCNTLSLGIESAQTPKCTLVNLSL